MIAWSLLFSLNDILRIQVPNRVIKAWMYDEGMSKMTRSDIHLESYQSWMNKSISKNGITEKMMGISCGSCDNWVPSISHSLSCQGRKEGMICRVIEDQRDSLWRSYSSATQHLITWRRRVPEIMLAHSECSSRNVTLPCVQESDTCRRVYEVFSVTISGQQKHIGACEDHSSYRVLSSRCDLRNWVLSSSLEDTDTDLDFSIFKFSWNVEEDPKLKQWCCALTWKEFTKCMRSSLLKRWTDERENRSWFDVEELPLEPWWFPDARTCQRVLLWLLANWSAKVSAYAVLVMHMIDGGSPMAMRHIVDGCRCLDSILVGPCCPCLDDLEIIVCLAAAAWPMLLIDAAYEMLLGYILVDGDLMSCARRIRIYVSFSI